MYPLSHYLCCAIPTERTLFKELEISFEEKIITTNNVIRIIAIIILKFV
ncbi:hypothetical protein CNEO2_100001 [Clostridium neonatale]|nr:hypothetical protein CNEO2_100001 [Clostridium neonatale]